jgi:putative flippase GtrA
MPESELHGTGPVFGGEFVPDTMHRCLLRGLTRVVWAREAIMFVLFGATAALTTLSVGYAFYGDGSPVHLPYWGSTGIAAAAGLVVNFALNYTFNFKFRNRSAGQQFMTFCLVAGFGIFLTSALSEIFFYSLETVVVGGVQLGNLTVPTKLAAHVLAVGVVALYSFPAHRLLSFNVGIGARLRQIQVAIADNQQ